MLIATFLGVFIIPGNFVFVLSLFKGKQPAAKPPANDEPDPLTKTARIEAAH